MNFTDFLKQLDASTELLESCRELLKIINSRSGHPPATMSELAAAMHTQIAINVITSQVDYLRDPDNYFEEETNHAQ